MSASMAEVLAEHAFHLIMPVDLDDMNGAWQVECNCTVAPIQGPSYLAAEAAFAAHQAEQLAANGYGKLEDAWAVVAEDLTAKSPRLPSDIRNAVFELVFDVVDKFNFPAQNCGYLKDVVEIGDVCGDVEKRIVALLRARAATKRRPQ